MKRLYESILENHFKENTQMAFISGPRQVGKTTAARAFAEAAHYINWDRQEDRILLTQGPDHIAEKVKLSQLVETKPAIIFDELHKYSKWKLFLKGFYDVYQQRCDILVTGSARLDTFKRGGDSLLGRYFPYRMHPFSVGETLSQKAGTHCINQPKKPDKTVMEQLYRFGGFPDPFIKASTRYHNRWARMRRELLIREDVRDVSRIHEIGQMEVLANILDFTASSMVNYTNLANDVNVSIETIQRWLSTLESLYYCFSIKPWFKNVSKSLRKQPKVYLWDWSVIREEGKRAENFIACHLLKAVHYWTDMGLGNHALYYLRDKLKREVDFLVVKEGIPWFLVEVKKSATQALSTHLNYFQKAVDAQHAFQVSLEGDFVNRDCFAETSPVRVPAATFLSQLP